LFQSHFNKTKKKKMNISRAFLVAVVLLCCTSLSLGAKPAFPSNVNLANLTGANGFTLIAEDANGDEAGYSLSAVGDVNGDGMDDFIVGAPLYSGVTEEGRSYVLFGSKAAWPAVIHLDTLNGMNGFSITGPGQGTQAGFSVSGAGDVNGDKMDDLLIGGPASYPNSGKAYVVYGRPAWPANVMLASLNSKSGVSGVTFSYTATKNGDYSVGSSVDGLGDIDGDGFEDIIIGAPAINKAFSKNLDLSFVVFGSATWAANFSLNTLTAKTGFTLTGENTLDGMGSSVSGTGDINMDGYADMIVGAPGYPSGDSTGRCYVIFGGKGPFANINLSALTGKNGFSLTGMTKGDQTGRSVSGAGDVNKDGHEDLVIGAPGYLTDQGRAYVVFGAASYPANVNLAALNGTNGFPLDAQDAEDNVGSGVSGAGDVNQDGFDDFIIGAPGYDAGHGFGRSYVVFGSAGPWPGKGFGLGTLNGMNGFTLTGDVANGLSGSAVSDAGDVNGDGASDVMIGAYAFIKSQGQAYVVFGVPMKNGTQVQDEVVQLFERKIQG